ncbi:acyltransferase family protein [Janibacter sp. G1551]|uniref:acyltransferase family protein n=1 Tax=Janibacter sp. G1551 TaxID=3420440 RepID=UPI003CFE6289
MRFLAAMLVALFHATMWASPTRAASGPLRFGYVGVAFFFVLSGFVLTWTWRRGDRAGAFYLRRVARVYPLHLLMTAVAAVLASAGVLIDANGKALPWHLLLLHGWVPDTSVTYAYNGLSWSLSDEAFFYLVFPVLVVLAASRWVGPRVLVVTGLVWLLIGGLVVQCVAPEFSWFLYTLPLYRVGEFALGMGVALAMRSGWRPPLPPWAGLAAATVGYLSLWVANRLTGGLVEGNYWMTHLIVLPGFVLAVATCAAGDLTGSGRGLLRHPWLVTLGQWSFALYLVHALVIRSSLPLLEMAPPGARVMVTTGAVCVSILLAGGLYEWWERPIEQRIRRWGGQRASVVMDKQ